MKKISIILLIVVFIICAGPTVVYADCASDAKNQTECSKCGYYYWKDGKCNEDYCYARWKSGTPCGRAGTSCATYNQGEDTEYCGLSRYTLELYGKEGNPGTIGDGFDDCEGLFGTPGSNPPDDVADYMQIAFNVIKFVGIILCILMTIIDYFKAIVSNEKEMLKAISKKALIRVVYVAVLFFVPYISEFLLSLIGVYGSCGIS